MAYSLLSPDKIGKILRYHVCNVTNEIHSDAIIYICIWAYVLYLY